MMRPLAFAVLLLTLPTFADAQCRAWVMWEEVVVYGPTEFGPESGRSTWRLRGAWETRVECDDGAAMSASNVVLKALENDQYDPGKVASFEEAKPSAMIVIRYNDGSRRVVDWKCLPDTLDPRPR